MVICHSNIRNFGDSQASYISVALTLETSFPALTEPPSCPPRIESTLASQPMPPSPCSFDSQMSWVVFQHMLWVLDTPTAWVLSAFLSYPLIIWNCMPAFEKLRIRRAPHWENSGSTWNHLFLENVKFMYNVTGSPTIVSSYHGRMPKGVVVTMSSKAIFWRLCPCEASPPSGR